MGISKNVKQCLPEKKTYFTCLPVSGILLEMIFCEIILKGDVFYRPIVSEHKYFIEKTTICCEWIKSLVSELSLVGALRDPWSYPHSYRGGCVYEGWGPMGDVHA